MSIAPHRVHPWIFMVLILPFGMVGGYASVTLAYQLKAELERTCSQIKMSVVPNPTMGKMLWVNPR